LIIYLNTFSDFCFIIAAVYVARLSLLGWWEERQGNLEDSKTYLSAAALGSPFIFITVFLGAIIKVGLFLYDLVN
jgi:Na+-driven multidrug efflux pump